jgi:predicted O-methyltransferase YrrM
VSTGDLHATLTALDGVEGWLSPDQVARLHAAGRTVPSGGQIVEIGSFRGRSAITLALAAPADAWITCIDPHLGSDRGPQEIEAQPELGDEDHAAFEANLTAAGVRERIRHVRAFSGEALDEVEGPIDVLFVDGAHRYGPALDDLRRWGDRVRPGGTMLVHDSFSSIGVTGALLRHMVLHRGWRYRGRARSLAVYERGANTPGAVLWQLAQLPWMVRNVLVKVLIVAGLGRVARRLGHRDGPWPY